MPAVGVHPRTDLPTRGDELAPAVRSGRSVAAVAAEIDALSERIEELGIELATLVRDGDHDPRPGWSANEMMIAAGRLTRATDVVGSLAFAQTTVTASHCDDGMRDPATWARHHAGLSGQTTSSMRRVGRCLDRYPELAAAFVDGRIATHHLRAVDAIIPARFRFGELDDAIRIITDVQLEMIAVAESSTEAEFVAFCRQVRHLLDPDGPEPTDGGGGSELHLRQLPNGRWTLYGELTADDGAMIATILAERVSAEIRANIKDDTNHTGNESDDPESAKPDHSVRMADALRSLLLDGAGAKRPGRVGLFLHMDLDDLAAMGGNVSARTEANLDITNGTLWGLLAGADVTPIMTDEGTPLSYGRTRRLAPDILRRALAFRDRSCWFPGCDRPPHMHQAHHEEWWERGGPTDPSNTRGGCSEHHHGVHDDGWNISSEGGGPGGVTITRPDGTVLDPTPTWQRRRHARDPFRRATLRRLEELAATSN